MVCSQSAAKSLPAGTWLLLPVYRSTTPIRLGYSFWCRSPCPRRRCLRRSGSPCRRDALLPFWMSCLLRRADGGPSGSCRLQAQMLDVGLEVAVAEQQRQVRLDAGSGDDPVDRLAHRDPLAA